MKLAVPFTLLLLFSFNSLADNNRDNPFWGCPENSLCTSSQGENWEAWREHLKKSDKNYPKLFKEHGIAFGHCYYYDPKKKNHPISWDSSCSHHRDNKPPIMKAIQVLKKGQEKKLLKSFTPVWLLNEKNEIKEYFVPLNVTITSTVNNDLIGLWEEDGHFIHFQISKNSFKIIPPPKATAEIFEELKCPKELMQIKIPQLHRPIFKERYCKSWSSKKRKKFIVMQLWSCP
jgi:hypothetical protein